MIIWAVRFVLIVKENAMYIASYTDVDGEIAYNSPNVNFTYTKTIDMIIGKVKKKI